MAPRANWKGFLRLGELSCPIALYTATSTSERISFHTLNRQSGNRVRREYVDAETGKPVPKEEQIKGYETAPGEYVLLEPEDVAAAVPVSDKKLTIEHFVGPGEVDDIYLDKPYYLAPAGAAAEDAYGLIREGMRSKRVCALARAVLFRRVRTLLLRPVEKGLLAFTLNFDYEVRSAREVFSDIGSYDLPDEMRDLARHIIDTKGGHFSPGEFHDRYETALAELIRAKAAGKALPKRAIQPQTNVVNLLEALRKSAGVSRSSAATKQRAAASTKRGARKTAPKKAAPRSRRRRA